MCAYCDLLHVILKANVAIQNRSLNIFALDSPTV
jgi:hypothetical protein